MNLKTKFSFGAEGIDFKMLSEKDGNYFLGPFRWKLQLAIIFLLIFCVYHNQYYDILGHILLKKFPIDCDRDK